MPEPDRPLPYVSLATFCEKVLQEKDGVLSAIRLVDTINVDEPSPAGKTIELTALIGLRSGKAKGSYDLGFHLHPPTGPSAHLATPGQVQLNGEEHAVTFALQVRLTLLQEPGLYWLDLEVDRRVLTRIPLRINYAATSTT
jgi:hypothetical protein